MAKGNNKYKTEDLIQSRDSTVKESVKKQRVNSDFWHHEMYPYIRKHLERYSDYFDSRWIKTLEKDYYYEPDYIKKTIQDRINKLTDRIESEESQELNRIWNTRDRGQLDELGARLEDYMANEQPELLKIFNEEGFILGYILSDPLLKNIIQTQRDLKEREYLVMEKLDSPVVLVKPERSKTPEILPTSLQREQAIRNGENKFNQLPMEEVLNLFKVLTHTNNYQGKPLLSMDQVYTLVESAFLKMHTEKITFNLGPKGTGDRTEVRYYFYDFYFYCSGDKKRDHDCSKSKYVSLLCDHCNNFDYNPVFDNFNKKRRDKKRDL